MRAWQVGIGYAVLLLVISLISQVGRSTPAAAGHPLVPHHSRPPRDPAPTAAHSSMPPHHDRHRVPRLKGQLHHLDVVRSGIVLPDRRVTPGAVDHRIRQANIQSTICTTGYTTRVRPAASYTTSLKQEQLRHGYTLHADTRTSDYEEDHLIPLELGGNPASPRNLWPEPYAGSRGARAKDRLENVLQTLVCNYDIPLRAAQHALASNWWIAYRRYILAPERTPATSAPSPPPTPALTRHAHRDAKPIYHPPVHRHPKPIYHPPAHSCTTTSSGSCIQGGEFCPQADYGMTGYDASGRAYLCTGDTTHPHWED